MDIKGFFTGIFNWVKDNKSDLKMGIGTAGVIGGTVVLCKSAIKVSEIVTEYKKTKQELIDNEAEKKDIRNLTVKTVGKVAVTVLPGAAVEASGLGLMWSGYSDMKVAFVGAGLAFNELKEFTDKYRSGVREKYGEEEDERLAYQFQEKEITVKDENGREEKKTVRVYPHDARLMPSPYARYFCYGEAEGAEKSHTYNKHFLNSQIPLMNAYLMAHKRFMLNDCYDMLGIRRSKAGFHVGWIYDPEDPEGDNRIDLRVQEVYREILDEQGNVVDYEPVLMIDPNVDGMVEDKMIRMGLIDQ